jgi:hypothetical protein
MNKTGTGLSGSYWPGNPAETKIGVEVRESGRAAVSFYVVASCGDTLTRDTLSPVSSTLHISGMGISEENLCTVQRHSYKRAVPGKGLQ